MVSRFLFVVLGAYQQMHIQTAPILGELDEENFDRAFDMFRPGRMPRTHKLITDLHSTMYRIQ